MKEIFASIIVALFVGSILAGCTAAPTYRSKITTSDSRKPTLNPYATSVNPNDDVDELEAAPPNVVTNAMGTIPLVTSESYATTVMRADLREPDTQPQSLFLLASDPVQKFIPTNRVKRSVRKITRIGE